MIFITLNIRTDVERKIRRKSKGFSLSHVHVLSYISRAPASDCFTIVRKFVVFHTFQGLFFANFDGCYYGEKV